MDLTCKTDPFEYFYKDNLLSEGQFDILRKEFLSICKNHSSEFTHWYSHVLSSNTKLKGPINILGGGRASDTYGYFLDISKENYPTFSKFLIMIHNIKFYRDFFPSLSNNKRIRILRKGKKISFIRYLLFNYVYVGVKFSRYTPESGISIHPDNEEKMYALLYFMGFSDGKERAYGGTQMYATTSNSSEIITAQGNHQHLAHELFQVSDDISPTSNRIAGFRVAKNSYHGVLPLPSDNENLTRDNIQINLFKYTLRDVIEFTYLLKAVKFIKNTIKYFLKKFGI